MLSESRAFKLTAPNSTGAPISGSWSVLDISGPLFFLHSYGEWSAVVCGHSSVVVSG